MTRLSPRIQRFPFQLGVHVFVAGLLTAACAGSAASSSAGAERTPETTAATETTTTTAPTATTATEPTKATSAPTATTATPIKPQEAPTTTTKPAASGDPTAVLVGLRVAPEGPRAGYKRELFVHWVDADRDGCDSREEVLIAESRGPAQVDPYGCKVVEGDWYSAYDGLTFTDPSELDIDHMVALGEAWDSGAAGWDAGRRQAFANDLDHRQALRAVSASSNRSKSDLDPGQWKPTRDAAWCEYANDWVTVKKAWDLTADQNEVDDLRVMLRTCGEESPSAAPAPSTTATTAKPTTTTTVPPTAGGSVTITALNCRGETVTVRNAGTAPADLAGWSIHDEASTAHTYRFAAGYTLARGASVTIRSGGPAGPGELPWTNQNVWNNDGDTASLVNARGAVVSTRTCS